MKIVLRSNRRPWTATEGGTSFSPHRHVDVNACPYSNLTSARPARLQVVSQILLIAQFLSSANLFESGQRFISNLKAGIICGRGMV
jgi:hypothetical protein